MLEKREKSTLYEANHGWLESRFHFSFAEYRDYDNINFGVLRVLNDDIIHPQSGFEMHPHKDMEIISYIVDGEITHEDSMGNKESLKRGEVQYLSAGEGIYHSEKNASAREKLRLLQIWITPPEKNLERLYGSYKYTQEQRKNRLLNIVSSKKGSAEVKIHQDVNIFVCELDKEKSIEYTLHEKRAIYFIQIEGDAKVNGIEVSCGDAIKIEQEKKIRVEAIFSSHFLFIEMANK